MKCPVCGKYEFEEKNDHDICPYCDWENDNYEYRYPDSSGGANGISLNQARKNYKVTGTIYEEKKY